jgi:hypothetical protein
MCHYFRKLINDIEINNYLSQNNEFDINNLLNLIYKIKL